MRRVMVNRGPQFVQFRNGYRYLRSAGSSNSRRQSPQVAASAGIPVATRPRPSLATIRNPLSPIGSASHATTESIRESGGASSRSRRQNASNRSGRPSISMVTPLVSLPMKPASRSSDASRYTNGLNPTPCTTPRTASTRRLNACALFRSELECGSRLNSPLAENQHSACDSRPRSSRYPPGPALSPASRVPRERRIID